MMIGHGTKNRFRQAALAAAVIGAAVITSFSAAAQQAAAPQTLPDAQCKTAVGVTIATVQKYKGRLSPSLLKGFDSFIKDCDLRTKFDRVPGTADDDAWAEFRTMITALRTAELKKPSILAKN